MPSVIKTGISAAGASTNNHNLVQWHTGRRMVRSRIDTRAVLSRVELNEADKIDSYTVATS